MISRIVYFIIIFALVIFSCKVKRKEYIERNGLHSDDKPSQIAKDIGSQQKKQKKAYSKQLRRTNKAIKKRNKQKLKNIVIKIKTKKVRGTTEKGDTPKTKEVRIK